MMMFQCNQNDSKMILLWSSKGFGCNLENVIWMLRLDDTLLNQCN